MGRAAHRRPKLGRRNHWEYRPHRRIPKQRLHSLGTADRLSFAGGTRAFLKAVNEADQAQTAQLHRAEIKATALLPQKAPTPALLASYDKDGWVALLLEDIDGKHPQMPWSEKDLISAFEALDELARLRHQGIEELEELSSSILEELTFWDKIVAQPLRRDLYKHLEENTLLSELETHFDALNARAPEFAEAVQVHVAPALAGDCIVHSDLRADNILLKDKTEALIIDWPWACQGAAWFDTACLLADVIAKGGDFVWENICQASTILQQAPRALLQSFIIALAGYYIFAAQVPPRGDTNSSLPAFRLERGLNLARWILA